MKGATTVSTRLDFSRRSVWSVADRALEVFKQSPLTLLGCTALADVPAMLAVATLVVLVERSGEQGWGDPLYIAGVIAMSMAVAAALILKPIAEGAVAHATLQLTGVRGTPAPAGILSSWRAASRNASSLVVLSALRVAGYVLGLLLGALPIPVIVAVTGFYAQIATDERRGALDTLRRNLALARYGWMACVWIALLGAVAWALAFVNLFLLTRLAYLLFLSVTPWDAAGLLVRPATLWVLAALARLIVEPLVGVASTVAYLDARADLDAFDLTWRARHEPELAAELQP